MPVAARVAAGPGRRRHPSAREDILPRARQAGGWQGLLAFADRATGSQVLVTLWDSQDSMQASEHQADQLRQESAEAGSGSIKGVERYEVVFQEVAVGTSV